MSFEIHTAAALRIKGRTGTRLEIQTREPIGTLRHYFPGLILRGGTYTVPDTVGTYYNLQRYPGKWVTDVDLSMLEAEYSRVLAATAMWQSEEVPELPTWDGQGCKPPWDIQRRGFAFASMLSRAVLWFDMGVGKSRIAIDLLRHRNRLAGDDPWWALIVAPKGIVSDVWPGEFEEWCSPDQWVYQPLTKGTAQKKAERLADLAKFGRQIPGVLHVGGINYDSVWRPHFEKVLLANPPSVLILDEVHRIKGAGSKVSRFMARLAPRVPYVYGLSGTLLAHDPGDAFGTFRAIDPAMFGTSNDTFKHLYGRFGGFENRQVIAWDQNTERYQSRLFFFTKKVDAKDVHELPPVTYVNQVVPLSEKIMKPFRELRDEFLTVVQSIGSENEEGEVVTTSHAMTRHLRLQQMSCGFTKTEEGELLDLHRDREKALEEWAADIPREEPLVVFLRFTGPATGRHSLEAVRRAFSKKRGNRTVYQYTGEKKELAQWKEHAQGMKAGHRRLVPRGGPVLAVNLQAGSEGISLVLARHICYFSLPVKLYEWEQSQKRFDRPGQERPCRVVILQSPGTMDAVQRRSLQAKKNLVDYVAERGNEISFEIWEEREENARRKPRE